MEQRSSSAEFRLIDGALVADDGKISVEVDARTGVLRRLRNTVTGQELIDGQQTTPWRMTPQGASTILPPALAARYRPPIAPADFAHVIEDDGAVTLRWETTEPGLGVVVRLCIVDGALECWPRVQVADRALPPVRLTYPVLERPPALSSDPGRDVLAWPAQSGWLIRNPLAGRPLAGFYPDGFDGVSTQLFAYLAEKGGGFSVACHDPHSTCKHLRFSRAEIAIDHEAWDLRRGTEMDLDYPVVITAIERDWYEAVARYRDWAITGAPWTHGGVANANRADTDRARWLFEEVGLALWGGPSSLDWSPWYRFYASLGIPLHITAGWDWAAQLPPTAGREGWFPARFHPENVKAWRGQRVTPYMNDLFMSPRAKDFDKTWEPHLIFPYQSFDWTLFSEPWPGWIDGERPAPEPFTTAVHDLFMCPATSAQQELHAWRDATLARDYNCDGVTYDISSGNPRVGSRCLRAEHGHSPGRGRAIIKAYDAMNRASKDATRRDTGRYLAQGVETICETALGSVDYYVARACAGPQSALESWFVGPEDSPGGTRELIPFFQAIYHDVGPVPEDGWLTLSKDQGDLFFWIAARIYLQWGGLLSLQYADHPPERLPDNSGPSEVIYWNGARLRFDDLPEADPRKIAFVQELARARLTFGRDYLAYGRILRPLELPEDNIDLSYAHRLHTQRDLCAEGSWAVPRIMHAAWAAPSGAIGLFFVNLDPLEPVALSTTVDPGERWSFDTRGRTARLRTTFGCRREPAVLGAFDSAESRTPSARRHAGRNPLTEPPPRTTERARFENGRAPATRGCLTLTSDVL